MVTFQSSSAVYCESRFRFRGVRSFRSVRRVGGGSYGGGSSDDSGTSIGKEFQLTTTGCCNTGIVAYKRNLNMFLLFQEPLLEV